ncbi:MAG: hypothetical protein ACRCUY_00790 [Thermoguttaceae bacterium]
MSETAGSLTAGSSTGGSCAIFLWMVSGCYSADTLQSPHFSTFSKTMQYDVPRYLKLTSVH